MRFAGATIIITGAAGGLGSVMATAFAAEGGRVVLVDLPASPGEMVAEQISRSGPPGSARFAPCDLADLERTAAVIAGIVASEGVSVLVNNAGKAFGCVRVVFNDALHAREAAHQAGEPYVSDNDLSARLTVIKKAPERAWLNEVSSVVLQQALADLNVAYRNFFASLNGTRKGPKVAKPRFRSRKDHRQTIRFTANARFRVLANGKLRLPKIGDVPVRWSRPLPSEPSSVTVIKDSAGRYFASFVVETSPAALPEAEPVVGIDLGLGHFAVLSDGRKITAPRFLRRAEKLLKRRQRDLSRKQKGSRNRDKARVKVARAHARVADARRDFSTTSSPRH